MGGKIFAICLLIPLIAVSQKQKSNIINKQYLEASDQTVINFEKFISANVVPKGDNINAQFNDKDYKFIVWRGGSNNDIYKYSVEKMELIGYEYLKISASDSKHKTYVYRNCAKNMVFEVTEWFYEKRVSLSLQWYSDTVKYHIGYLMYCDIK